MIKPQKLHTHAYAASCTSRLIGFLEPFCSATLVLSRPPAREDELSSSKRQLRQKSSMDHDTPLACRHQKEEEETSLILTRDFSPAHLTIIMITTIISMLDYTISLSTKAEGCKRTSVKPYKRYCHCCIYSSPSYLNIRV